MHVQKQPRRILLCLAQLLNRECLTTEQPSRAPTAPPCRSMPRGIAGGASWAKPGRSRSLASTSPAASASISIFGSPTAMTTPLLTACASFFLVFLWWAQRLPELRLRLRDHPSLICLQPLIRHVPSLASLCARRRSQRTLSQCRSSGAKLATSKQLKLWKRKKVEKYDARRQVSVTETITNTKIVAVF